MSKLTCEVAEHYAHEGRRGRLGEDEAAELAQHLLSCEACRASHRRESALDAALSRLPRSRAPEALTARLQALSSVSQPPTRPRSQRWLAVACALAAAAALLGVFFGPQRGPAAHAALASEAVSDHLRVLYADRGPEVQSGGIHQVKPWFEGRLDFAPVLAFDGDEEFPLVGGSVAYFQDRKAAAFAFQHRLHRITLLVFRAEGLPLPAPSPAGRAPGVRLRSRGFDVVLWQRGELGYALVSDMAGRELEQLAIKIDTAK
jgi:anti-sigma factor RsiW